MIRDFSSIWDIWLTCVPLFSIDSIKESMPRGTYEDMSEEQGHVPLPEQGLQQDLSSNWQG